jgi:integrase
MARGFIVKRGSSYRVMVSYTDDYGKRVQVTGTATSSPKAEKLKTALLSEIDKGNYVKSSKLSVKAYLTQWVDDYVTPNLSPNTAETYRFIAKKHIIPALGDVALSKLRPQLVQSLYSEKLKSGLSHATVQKIHNILHKCLENAVRTGLIMRNPLVGVDCPKVQRREMTTMNETDIHLLLDYAQSSPYYSLFYTLIFTGLRRGEALALKWGDVDLLLLKASINKSLSYLNTPKDGSRILLKAPKTAKSRRFISITPSNAIVLREYHETTDRKRQSIGLPPLTDNDFVFCTFNDGNPYLPNSITHAWIKLTRRCGLPGKRLHDCRHSYASLLLRQNVHPSVVANQLGHASVRTTLDIYSHSIPALQEAAAMKFDDIVIGKQA